MIDEQPIPPIQRPPAVRETWPSWLWLVSLVAVGILIGLGSLEIIRPLARPVALFIIGVTIASALAPAVSWLERRMSRGLSIALVYLVLVLALVGVGAALTPLLVSQARDFGARAPALMQQLQDWFNDSIPITMSQLSSSLGALGSAIVSLPLAIVNSLLDLIVIFFISLYWMILNPQLKAYALSLFPEAEHAHAEEIFRRMGQGMGGYLRGSAINGIIIGMLTYIGLGIIGVNFPAVLSLVMGILEIIPALGPTIGGAFIVLVAFLQAPQLAIVSLVYVIVLQQMEGHILVPNIMKTQTEISPLLVILALLGGVEIGGLLGALVAIPLAAAIKVLVDEFVAPAIRKRTGAVQREVS